MQGESELQRFNVDEQIGFGVLSSVQVNGQGRWMIFDIAARGNARIAPRRILC